MFKRLSQPMSKLLETLEDYNQTTDEAYVISSFCPQISCNAEKKKQQQKSTCKISYPNVHVFWRIQLTILYIIPICYPQQQKITVFSVVTHGNHFISNCLLLLKNFEVQRELHKKMKVQRELFISRLISSYVRLVKIMKHFPESKFDWKNYHG